MSCATVEHYGLPIISVIFNNGTLGMVRQWQSLIYGERYSATTLDRGPDFVKLAEAYGLKGFRVTTRQEMEQALAAALDAGCGAVIDCVLDIDEMVRPMVAGGRSHHRLSAEGGNDVKREFDSSASSTPCASWWRTSPAY